MGAHASMGRMKHAADMARLRALACMGLTPQAFIPALLELLHELIPSDRNLFDWTDARGRLLYYYFEGDIDPEINRHYFEVFHNRKEAEVMPSFHEALTSGLVVHSAARLERPEFFRSALYNEIWRPQRLHTRLEAVVRGSGGELMESLVLYRGQGERSFGRAEELLLERVVPYVASGLQAGAMAQACQGFVQRLDRRAVLCLGPQGELQHLSPQALKLLLLAHGGVTPQGAGCPPRRENFATLTALWEQHKRAMAAAAQGIPLSLSVENVWGRFVFEACELRPLDPGEASLLHITLQHQEPGVLAMRRALDRLNLSPTQKEVCLQLQAGHTQLEIARLMAVSPSTIADHVRKIYGRLDVHSAHELAAVIQRQMGSS